MEAADRQDCSLVTALPSDVSSLKVLRKFVADDAFGKQSNASLNALKMPTSLEVVGLNRVHLSSVPVWIFAQKRLKRLTLPYGKLSQLPKDISKLQALEYLDLSMNNLQTLSKEIARIESLRGLDKLSREDSLSIGHSHHLIVAYFDTGASDV
jgi:Leucine-rich repeat (LRR) protein